MRKDWLERLKKKPKDVMQRIIAKTIRHEKIHYAQQKELYFIGFYVLYIYWWARFGYKNIPFEKEAKGNQSDIRYLKTRKHKSYLNYVA